jgi:glycosyltransferase involved in cell wall biosynthesis
MRTFALAAYPVSGAFRAALGADVELLVLPELRRLGTAALARRLASLSGSCLIALEDPGSEALLPILEGLATVTRARTIEIVRPGGRRERVSRARGAAHVARLAAATADAQAALRLARRDVARLLAQPRADAAVDGRRILFLNANLWFGVQAGGSIAHVAGVVNALQARGHDVELATAPAPIGVAADVTIRRLRPPQTYALPIESNLYRFGRSVTEQLRTVQRPAFVYQRHSVGSYAGAALARRLDVPLVLEYNGSEVWIARTWGRPLQYERLAADAEEASLRHAHRVITISEPLADELAARGVERERIVWHPNGVDAERFDPMRFDESERRALRKRYGIPPDAVLVTFVGTFGQWHGVDVLARAVRAHADWARERGVRFLLVGDGLRMADVRRELAGVEDVAVLAGLVPQDEAPLHLAASDILVSPHVANADGSPFFGSPTKLFEYMAAGKAIVASDLDQVGDVVRGVGVLVPPGEAGALGRAIAELAADPARRAELGAAARARVLERYTWDHHVGAILDAL